MITRITEDEIRAESGPDPATISPNNWAKQHEKSVRVHFSLCDDGWEQFKKKAGVDGFSAASKLSQLIEKYLQANDEPHEDVVSEDDLEAERQMIAKAIKLIHLGLELLGESEAKND